MPPRKATRGRSASAATPRKTPAKRTARAASTVPQTQVPIAESQTASDDETAVQGTEPIHPPKNKKPTTQRASRATTNTSHRASAQKVIPPSDDEENPLQDQPDLIELSDGDEGSVAVVSGKTTALTHPTQEQEAVFDGQFLEVYGDFIQMEAAGPRDDSEDEEIVEPDGYVEIITRPMPAKPGAKIESSDGEYICPDNQRTPKANSLREIPPTPETPSPHKPSASRTPVSRHRRTKSIFSGVEITTPIKTVKNVKVVSPSEDERDHDKEYLLSSPQINPTPRHQRIASGMESMSMSGDNSEEEFFMPSKGKARTTLKSWSSEEEELKYSLPSKRRTLMDDVKLKPVPSIRYYNKWTPVVMVTDTTLIEDIGDAAKLPDRNDIVLQMRTLSPFLTDGLFDEAFPDLDPIAFLKLLSSPGDGKTVVNIAKSPGSPIHNLGFRFGPNKGQQALFYTFNTGEKEAKGIQLMLIGCRSHGYNQFWNNATESTQIITSFWAHTHLVSPNVSQPSTSRGNTNNLSPAISHMGITRTQNVRSTAQMIRAFYNNSDDYPIFDASQHFKVDNPAPGFRVEELSNLPIYSGPKPHSNELRLYDLALVYFTVNTYSQSDVDLASL
ncbi:uncharacterized protein BXZ73DRAFT_96492 [Epithele typhae]|uniref:uncharacterized protein n=1 Tax=Epithele typhae TaxID=378194 RepID=UPI002008AF87|nr:uncharacterized protein BXZ73DRAFT_96492 [Epithele typhae]KAH9945502.1 hypothetical protein BXZ73DRAFT_96492 [Epithele typhae]